jgi:Cdc6-like AAA superfamily ATPase
MAILTPEEARQVSIQAGQVFQPRTPISTRELFAGRWKQLTEVADAVGQVGLHVVVYGERGVGKTSLANVIRPVLHVFDSPPDTPAANGVSERLVVKVNGHMNDTFGVVWRRALDEISIAEERPVLGFGRAPAERNVVPLATAWNLQDPLHIDDVRRILSSLPGAVFIFDEFDRMQQAVATEFTDLIKALSDFQTAVTIVLVGVADTIDGLLREHASIGRALVQVHMPRMRREELSDILKKAEEKLAVRFELAAAQRIVQMSLGLPHYTHLVGLASVRKACERLSRAIDVNDVSRAMEDASRQAEQSLITEYSTATRSAHRDALYTHVLLACAITASTNTDELGFFRPSSVVEPLEIILPDRRIEIATFNKHLADFCNEKRGRVLQRTGQERAFRYRFRNPLLPPYVILKGLASKHVTMEQVERLTSPVR